jgi:hypothetical protein
MLMKVYLKLLGDPYWRGQALDAILVWYVLQPEERGEADGRMQDETARVEDALLDRDATAAIMNCFVQSSGSHLEKVIDRYVPISQQS